LGQKEESKNHVGEKDLFVVKQKSSKKMEKGVGGGGGRKNTSQKTIKTGEKNPVPFKKRKNSEKKS